MASGSRPTTPPLPSAGAGGAAGERTPSRGRPRLDTPFDGGDPGDALSVIVIGASGDLAKKKTYPALFELFLANLLPINTTICGFARSKKTDEDFRDHLFGYLKGGSDDKKRSFLELCIYRNGQYDSVDSFREVSDELSKIEADLVDEKGSANRLFYFAIPPSVFVTAAASIRGGALTDRGWNRVVVEKPFGRDAESSRELSKGLAEHLEESMIYRIDHYLGKEMVQNLMIMRFANVIFEPLFNRNHVSIVQITFKEPFGTEGRGGYFDDIGIVRDVMQNHLMQVLSLVAMEPPVTLDPEDIRDEKVKVLRAISPLSLEDIVIGQYAPNPQGTKPGYRDDEGVPDDSKTATFATAVLYVNNSRWSGVPFVLKCGKALNERKADIRIQFKQSPSPLYRQGQHVHNNELVMRIQPNEAVWVKMNSKLPGLSSSPVETELDLSYKTRFPQAHMPEAYARLLLDVLRGDHAQFVRDDELKAAWAIFSPLLHKLDAGEKEPIPYPYGSRGPKESDDFIQALGFNYDIRYSHEWRRKDAEANLAKFRDAFTLTRSRMLALLNDFMLEMDRGLAGEESSIAMIPSYVQHLPTSSESGPFIAIDLGGSNLRVIYIQFDGAGSSEVVREKQEKIPDEVMKGSASDLFGFIALQLKKLGPEPGAKVGFTFSFPVDQTAIDAGTLMSWTKGFEVDGVVGEDVVALLRKSIAEQDVDVEVVALVNDTVGTLMAKAFHKPETRIGVILGTGTNAAYVERAAAIPKWEGSREGIMVINMEWGGFGSGAMGRSLLPVTEIDQAVDADSPNPTKQRFEKMISGLYLGEMARRAMLQLTSLGVLHWGDHGVPEGSCLHQRWKFDTSIMSRLVVDTSDDLDDVRICLREEIGVETSLSDRRVIVEVCDLIATRAARLAAVGVAAVVAKMGADADKCIAGIDGSVFLKYPGFKDKMQQALTELGCSCTLEGARDGSGLGAAVIAAAASSKL